MNARKIAISLPAPQFAAIERARKRLKLRRSEAIQEALDIWLKAREGDARVQQYIEGYLARPDDPREALAYVRAWAAGVESEEW